MKPILLKLSKQWLSKRTSIFYRTLYHKIDFNARIIGIKGSRGSGKTTLLHQYAKNSKLKPSQILYVSCDSPVMAGEDLFELATDFEKYGGRLLLIDEIHKSFDFATHIKSMYDFLKLHVIFTGSSAMIINHESGDLSRRASMHYLPAMSLREFITLKEKVELPAFTLSQIIEDHENISFEILEKLKPLEHYKHYLQYGAYPFFKESIADYPMRLLEVINITIESDLAKIFNIDNEKQSVLKRILGMLCSTSPYEISKSKLSKDTDIAWATLSKYLSYMAEGDLLHLIEAPQNQKRLNKAQKMLLNNPNLFYVLCANPDIGSVRESFFVSQLSSMHTVHYHDRGDFIVDDTYVFEIGGPSKGDAQLANVSNGFVVRDELETGYANVIPLWLFGFLY